MYNERNNLLHLTIFFCYNFFGNFHLDVSENADHFQDYFGQKDGIHFFGGKKKAT